VRILIIMMNLNWKALLVVASLSLGTGLVSCGETTTTPPGGTAAPGAVDAPKPGEPSKAPEPGAPAPGAVDAPKPGEPSKAPEPGAKPDAMGKPKEGAKPDAMGKPKEGGKPDAMGKPKSDAKPGEPNLDGGKPPEAPKKP
jgi:hypothetical protein